MLISIIVETLCRNFKSLIKYSRKNHFQIIYHPNNQMIGNAGKCKLITKKASKTLSIKIGNECGATS